MYSLLKYFPPELAHELAPTGLQIYSDFFAGENKTPEWQPFTWKGIHFSNRLGTAGGVDKNAVLINAFEKLGAGFVEVGTVTPRPQKANPGKVIDRNWQKKILWNKLGFPSDGAADVFCNLAQSKHQIPIFINLGKNRETKNLHAADDYAYLIDLLKPHADVFVINISSPNTQGLRHLQSAKEIEMLIKICKLTEQNIPLLVKLSPDLNEENLQSTVLSAAEAGASGFILTNSTIDRESNSPFPKEGGLSGSALTEKSKSVLIKVQDILGQKRKDLLLVSVGGILSIEEIKLRLSLGADLVQIYSMLVFEGPSIFKKVANACQIQK